MPSAVIQTIDYDVPLSRLTVTFTTGRIYEYFAVPQAVVDDFRSAASKGAYLNVHIRDVYPCKERRAALPADASEKLRDDLMRSAGKRNENDS